MLWSDYTMDFVLSKLGQMPCNMKPNKSSCSCEKHALHACVPTQMGVRLQWQLYQSQHYM